MVWRLGVYCHSWAYGVFSVSTDLDSGRGKKGLGQGGIGSRDEVELSWRQAENGQEIWVLPVLTGGLGESFPSSEPHRHH